MNREEKQAIVQELNEKFSSVDHFYITDSSNLTVAEVNDFRRKCFENEIEFRVVKNTLLKKAMEANDSAYDELYDVLKGPTSLMFTKVANAPAKVIKEFLKKHEKPVMKAAYIDSDVYVGAENLDALAALKSKEELIGDVIGLLQSPVKNVIGALQSGGHTISGVIKTLSEKTEE